MIDIEQFEVWLVDRQPAPLRRRHRWPPSPGDAQRDRARRSAQSPHVPVRVVCKPVLTTPEAIRAAVPGGHRNEPTCAGLVALDAHLFAGQDVDRWAFRS
jgi:hypothetical protein